MKLVCQTCTQFLPKTAMMCPNCGSRHLFPENQSPVAGTDMSAMLDDVGAKVEPYQNTTNVEQVANEPQVYQEKVYQDSISQENLSQEPVYQEPIYQEPVSQTPIFEQSTYDVVGQSALPPTCYTHKRANQMQYTGVFKRGFAWVIDLVLVAVVLGLGYQFLLPDLLKMAGMTALNEPTLAVIALNVYVVYMAMFTCMARQGTIGKMIMGLWVFDTDGHRIGFFHAVLREIFKVLLLPLFFVGWFTARKQNLADLITQTVVLYDPS